MLTADEIKKSKAKEEAKRKKILTKKLRNKRENLEVSRTILCLYNIVRNSVPKFEHTIRCFVQVLTE